MIKRYKLTTMKMTRDNMGMTIEEALETIKGERWIACSEKYHEAMNLITDTMYKYQNIEDVMKNYRSNPIDCLFRIRRILEG